MPLGNRILRWNWNSYQWQRVLMFVAVKWNLQKVWIHSIFVISVKLRCSLRSKGSLPKAREGNKVSTKNKEQGEGIGMASAFDLLPSSFPLFEVTFSIYNVIDNKHNSLHLRRKYARILVLGHYLFLEAHSFPPASPLGKLFASPSIFSLFI